MGTKEFKIIAIGFAVTVIVFGAFVYFSESNATSNFSANSSSGFDNFNTRVADTVDRNKDKTKADYYEEEENKKAELEERAKREKEALDRLNQREQKSDLTEIISETNRNKKAVTSLEQKEDKTALVEQPKKVSTYSGQNKSIPKKEKVEQPKESTEPVKRVRKRNSDSAFDLEEEKIESESVKSDAFTEQVKAIVHGNQQVTDRSRITLRIEQPLSIGDCTLKANSLITGVVLIDQTVGRAFIQINSIKCGDKPYQVLYSAYSISDGGEGIPFQTENVNQQVNKEVIGEATNEVSRKLNIPILGRAVSSSSEKRIAAPPSLKLITGTELIIKHISAEQ